MIESRVLLPPAFLVIGGSKIFTCTKDVIKIGRSRKNDLILEDTQVSRLHAEICFKEGHFEIVDLNSTGGTFVNNEKISSQTLNKGDVITLANVYLVFGQGELPSRDKVEKYSPPVISGSTDVKTITLKEFKADH